MSAKKKKGKKSAQRFHIAMASAGAGASDPELEKVQKFLTRFGYLRDVVTMGTLDKKTAEAVTDYQRSHGIKATGKLNKKTIEQMEAARCGVPDVELASAAAHAASSGASAGFTLRGCKYNTQTFTYRFENGTGDVAGTQERAAVRRAFQTWADALCVRFTERTSGTVDFRIGWFTGSHGDGSPFDGVGNTLAHAFYPPPCGGAHAGDCHFDDAETWSLTGGGGSFDIETVALHEIGHLLGLAHSSVSGSVMFPSYGGVRRALTQDDLDGVRRLYPSICRRGDSGGQAGFVGEIAAARHGTRQVVNAVRTQAGTLKLIAWKVSNSGSVKRTGDSSNQAGKASHIDITRGSATKFVTACRTGSGKLRLISWAVNATGSKIKRLGDSGSQAGRATEIRVAAMNSKLYVVAVRTASKTLKLIAWRLNGNGSLSRLADSGSQAGKVSEIALVRVASDRVVTAVRTSSGRLKLIHWKVTASSIKRISDSANKAGKATLIRATVDRHKNVVTAVRTAGGDLKLIAWKVPSSGAIQRRGDSDGLAGEIRDHDVMRLGSRLVSAVRTKSGNLKLIAWTGSATGPILRWGDSDGLAGNATLITLNEALAGDSPIVTSVRTQSSKLKLITWRPRT